MTLCLLQFLHYHFFCLYCYWLPVSSYCCVKALLMTSSSSNLWPMDHWLLVCLIPSLSTSITFTSDVFYLFYLFKMNNVTLAISFKTLTSNTAFSAYTTWLATFYSGITQYNIIISGEHWPSVGESGRANTNEASSHTLSSVGTITCLCPKLKARVSFPVNCIVIGVDL